MQMRPRRPGRNHEPRKTQLADLRPAPDRLPNPNRRAQQMTVKRLIPANIQNNKIPVTLRLDSDPRDPPVRDRQYSLDRKSVV